MIRSGYKLEIKTKKDGYTSNTVRKRLYTIWIKHESFWKIELKQELRTTFKNCRENGELLVFDRTRDMSHFIYSPQNLLKKQTQFWF